MTRRLPRLNPRLVIVIRYLLIAVALGFAIWAVVTQWSSVQEALAQIAPLSIAVSLVTVLLGLGAGLMSWVTILNGIGDRAPVPVGGQLMLVGQLGKYVPGSVWAYVMQMELGRQHGIARPRVLVTSLYAAGVGVVSSLVLGALALPIVAKSNPELLWLFALLPLGLALLHPRIMTWIASNVLRIFRREPLEHRIRYRTVALAVGWSLLSYLFYGLHLFVLVNSLVDPDLANLLLLTGAMALSFTLSLFAVVFPSGLGIREAVLVAAMSLVLTVAQATAVTLVSRIIFTVADLAAAGLAVLVLLAFRRRQRKLAAAAELVEAQNP
jgi:hypothetical protein